MVPLAIVNTLQNETLHTGETYLLTVMSRRLTNTFDMNSATLKAHTAKFILKTGTTALIYMYIHVQVQNRALSLVSIHS